MLCHVSAVSEGPSNIKIRLGQETGYATEINNFNGLGNFCVDGPGDSFNIGKVSIITDDNIFVAEQCGTRRVIEYCHFTDFSEFEKRNDAKTVIHLKMITITFGSLV